MMNKKQNLLIIALLLIILFISLVTAVSSSINIDVVKTRDLIVDFVPIDERKSTFDGDVSNNIEFLNSTYPLANNGLSGARNDLYFCVDNSTDSNNVDITDHRMVVTEDGVGIGTTTPSYPLEVSGDASDISIYASKNISATGFITRTSVFDKSQGDALDFVQDADSYLSNSEIDHSKFYGFTSWEVIDYDKPEFRDVFDEAEDKVIEEVYYPHTKIEEGVILDAEIDVLRQAVYELSQELCKKDDSYNWC